MPIQINPTPASITESLRQKLEQVSFATFGHLLEAGFVDPGIRAMVSPVKIVGRAITVRITPPDSVLVHKVIDLVEAGDVIIVDTGGDVRHAPVGEMVALAAKLRGAVAIVIDGVCTDITEIREMRMPVFARGTSLLTTKLLGLDTGGINVPVTCGGVSVFPGDVVLADENGVLILSPEVVAQVVDRALASDEREIDTRRYLHEGGSLPERTGANDIVRRLIVAAGFR